jgi:hypothetical protein
MYLNSKLINILNENNCRCTIILGSGFHIQALGEDSILGSWPKLLKNQDNSIQLTNCYPLDFEQLVMRSANNEGRNSNTEKSAQENENLISDEICSELKSAQYNALQYSKHKYPIGFLNPDYVSDVISLNFDTTALELCAEIANFEIDYSQFKKYSSSKHDDIEIPFYEVIFPTRKSIRFWFPHGSTIKNNPITLGTRAYATKLNLLERLRKHSKQKEGVEKNAIDLEVDTSWYHQMTHSPVLILGAEMSSDEWDMWFAIVNRERNFSKNSNKEFKYPIFQMRECESKNKIQTTWFEPLCIGLNYNDQWLEIEKQFNKNRN